MDGFQLLPYLANLLLNAVQLGLLMICLLAIAISGVVKGGLVSPTGVLISFFDDAAELRGTETCYYGLIHNYRLVCRITFESGSA